MLSSGFLVAKVVDEAPKVNGDVGEAAAVDPLDVPPNKVLPFTPFDATPLKENCGFIIGGASSAFPFTCISLTGLSSILTSWSWGFGGVTGLFDGTPKMKGDLVVTSVPPPPLKLNATGGVAVAGADVEDDDEPKVNGAAAGFTSGGVPGAAPKENDTEVTSCFFS